MVEDVIVLLVFFVNLPSQLCCIDFWDFFSNSLRTLAFIKQSIEDWLYTMVVSSKYGTHRKQASWLLELVPLILNMKNLKISPALYYSKLSAFFQRTLEIIYKMHPNKIIAEHKDLEFSKYWKWKLVGLHFCCQNFRC